MHHSAALLHRRVAQALETMSASDLDTVTGQIASHYERAGMIEQALPYYQRAAAVARTGLCVRRCYQPAVTLPGVARDSASQCET